MSLLAGMVRIQCTRAECAAVLEVSESTIDRRLLEDTGEGFDAFYKRHSDEGKVSLRRAQFKLAVEKRHPTMLIWLGKQMLGQQDTQTHKLTGPGGGPIEIATIERVIVDPAKDAAD